MENSDIDKFMEYIYTHPSRYKVFAKCFTYNQAKYIESTLNGFAIQKTNFPFMCLVMDDCSTDGEQEVIKCWLKRECDMGKAEYIDLELSNIIIAPHKTNNNCKFAVYLLKRNLWKEFDKKLQLITPWRDSCEYEALCEGDDYWISPDKLQKQVDYMDSHPQCTLCYTKAKVFDQNRNKVSGEGGRPYVDYNSLLLNNPIMTLTVMFPCIWAKKYQEEIHPEDMDWVLGDLPFWLFLAAKGTLHFIPEVTAMYRLQKESVSHSNSFDRMDRYNRSLREIRLIFNEKYNDSNPDIGRQINDDYYRRTMAFAAYSGNKGFYVENYNKLSRKTIIDKLKYSVFSMPMLNYMYRQFRKFRNNE